MSKCLRPFLVLLLLTSGADVFAQSTTLTSVHRGLAIETNSMGISEDGKKTALYSLEQILQPMVSDEDLQQLALYYSKAQDITEERTIALGILSRIDELFMLVCDPEFTSTILLCSALSPDAEGGLRFDCDTSALVYIAVLEKIFPKGQPVVLVTCFTHALIRWKFTDGTYIDWETTAGGEASSERYGKYKMDCSEVVPGSKAFYSFFYTNAAVQKVEGKDYKGALPLYDKAILFYPENSYAYAQRGVCKHDVEDHRGAFDDYTKAIELNPSEGYTYYNRAVVRIDLGDYAGALADIRMASKLTPEDKTLLGLCDQAKEVVAFNFLDPCRRRAGMRTKEGNYKAAIAEYDQVLKVDPYDGETYSLRAFLKYSTADYIGALYDYNKVIELDPKNAKAYKGRGLAKFKLEKYESAVKDYEMAAKLDPENLDTYRKYKEAAEARLNIARN